MTTAIAQVRLPIGLMEEVDNLVDKGMYMNKSDVIRDALRKLILEKQIGSIENTGDSVVEMRKIKQELSKDFKIEDLDEINALGE